MSAVRARSLTREQWRFLYRLQRIASREAQKAWTDTMLHGAGYVLVSPDGCRHVPWSEAVKESPA